MNESHSEFPLTAVTNVGWEVGGEIPRQEGVSTIEAE